MLFVYFYHCRVWAPGGQMKTLAAELFWLVGLSPRQGMSKRFLSFANSGLMGVAAWKPLVRSNGEGSAIILTSAKASPQGQHLGHWLSPLPEPRARTPWFLSPNPARPLRPNSSTTEMWGIVKKYRMKSSELDSKEMNTCSHPPSYLNLTVDAETLGWDREVELPNWKWKNRATEMTQGFYPKKDDSLCCNKYF